MLKKEKILVIAEIVGVTWLTARAIQFNVERHKAIMRCMDLEEKIKELEAENKELSETCDEYLEVIHEVG